MKAKKIFTFSLLALFLIGSVSTGLAQEKKKKKKGGKTVKGVIIHHPDKKDVKVLLDGWKTITINYDEKTKFEVKAKANESDLVQESTRGRSAKPPKGTVTYIMKDGKPVAQKISFSSRQPWKMMKKKKK